MALVDQFGSPYNHHAARSAARYTGQRPWEPVQLRDIGKLVPAQDRATLLSASRRLFLNEDILRGATEQKAMYAIGRAWMPKFTGTDKSFGDLAAKWLVEEFFPICDVRGEGFDFRTKLFLWSVGVDRDGETFELLTQTEQGYPQLQSIPCHRVNTPRDERDDEPLKGGLYRGLKICDGIVYNKNGAPVAIAYTDEEINLIEYISLRDAIQISDKSWQEQGRGLPSFTPSLNALRDALQSHEWEQMAQLMMSSIGLIEKNETGAPDFGDPSTKLTGSTTTNCETGITTESFAGGTVRYFRANSGGGLEVLKNDRPGDAWESFHDRIIRKALAGVNWPYALVWKPSGQGTAERHDIAKAQRAIEDRQDLLTRPALRCIGYAVSKAIKLGILPASADWYRWDFTYPQKLTIDDGRVSKELEGGWKAGWLNHTDVLGMMGKTPEDHYRQRASEIRMRKVIAKEFSTDGIEIEDREMAMLTPNEMPEQEPAQPTQSNANSDD